MRLYVTLLRDTGFVLSIHRLHPELYCTWVEATCQLVASLFAELVI